MTVNEAKNKVIQTAESEVGYREGENNWNKYAAELDPLNITYGNKQNLPWCGEWVLWVFYKCFGRKKALEMLCSPDPSGIPLCSAGAQYFKDANRWFSSPNKGDVIFFYSGGAINHTGIVVSVSGGVVYTVEGNSSDMVARRAYATGSSSIAGYGRPKWEVVAADSPKEDNSDATTAPKQDGIQLPVLRKGDTGEVVRAAQFLLNGRGASCGVWGADGDFGNATQAAVLAFQRRNGLEADGIVGQKTWAKLLGV